jgi:hypothetical protein
MGADVMRSIRLSGSIIKRAEVMARKLRERPDMASVGNVTLSSVLRQAIVTGLATMEKETETRKMPSTVDELLQVLDGMGVPGRSSADIDAAHSIELASWDDDR